MWRWEAKVGGFLGIGGSSAKTDRSQQLAQQGNLSSIFNWALPTGEAAAGQGLGAETSALSSLGNVQSYWNNIMGGGRAQVAQASAPAINAELAQSSAARASQSTFGTGRTGGGTAANVGAGTGSKGAIDTILNQTKQAAPGQAAQTATQTASVGSNILQSAAQLLGLSEDATKAIMQNATESRKTSYDINRQTQGDWLNAIGQLLMAPSEISGAGGGGAGAAATVGGILA
jgi:hypothetical protein